MMKVRNSHTLPFIFALAAMMAMASWPGRPLAQNLSCREIEDAAKGKIVIGEIKGAAGNKKLLERRIKSAIQMKFENADTELKSEAKVIICLDRKVEKVSAHNESLSKQLNSFRVLLEVGAEIDGGEAIVTFAIIPIRYREYFQRGNPKLMGYHEAVYKIPVGAVKAFLNALFKDNEDFRMMTALSLGVIQESIADAQPTGTIHDKSLDKARAFYCDAVKASISSKPTDEEIGLTSDDWESLSDYAKNSVERTMNAAINDADYRGALSLVADERRRSGGASANLACLSGAQGNP